MSTTPPAVIGVAGKCCAGKDEVTAWLLARGRREVNVDRIGHEALTAKRTEIVDTFGPVALNDSGAIDRRRLGRIVFSDAEQLRTLERIVHPWMREQVRERIERFHAGEEPELRGLVINAALLFHMHLDTLCNVVVLVRAPLTARFRRAIRRDDLTLRRVVQRLWTQRGLDSQAYNSPAETISVENGRSIAALHARLEQIPQLR